MKTREEVLKFGMSFKMYTKKNRSMIRTGS